jgi:hypothetical protein
MMYFLFESRAKPYCDETGNEGAEPSWQWTNLLWYPLVVVIAFLLPIVVLLYIIKELLSAAMTAFWIDIRSRIRLGQR